MSDETPNQTPTTTTYALDPAGPAPMSEVVIDVVAPVAAAPVADADQPPKNGRARGGLFAKGNRIARGNAKNRLASRWRSAVLNTISVDELEQIIGEIKRKALAGNMLAATAILRFIASDAMPKAGDGAEAKGRTKPAT